MQVPLKTPSQSRLERSVPRLPIWWDTYQGPVTWVMMGSVSAWSGGVVAGEVVHPYLHQDSDPHATTQHLESADRWVGGFVLGVLVVFGGCSGSGAIALSAGKKGASALWIVSGSIEINQPPQEWSGTPTNR